MATKAVSVLIQNLPSSVDTSTGKEIVLTVDKNFLIGIFEKYKFDQIDITIEAKIHQDGISYAYAILKFENYDEAQMAVDDFNYVKFDSNMINMKILDDETQKILLSGTGTLLIKNLSSDITDNQLFEAFSQFGEVINCIIPSKDGESYHYGIVQFRDQNDADNALNELNNATFNDQKIEIYYFTKEKYGNIDELCTNYHNLISVSGMNAFRQIFFKFTKMIKETFCVSPAEIYPLNCSPLSFSLYSNHSIIVMQNSKAIGIGDNTSHQINYFNLPVFQAWSPVAAKQSKNRIEEFKSVVCGGCYSLFLCKPRSAAENPILALSCSKQKKNSKIIDTSGLVPISLYGGELVSASIDEKGAIIIIDDQYNSSITNLPNNKKPVQIACMNKSVIVLSSDGFLYEISENSEVMALLPDVKFTHISGTSEHFLAVTINGAVYARGNNEFGQLGIGSANNFVSKLTIVKKFSENKIVSAFAGKNHSLFIDAKGAVYACGSNMKGELMIDSEIESLNQPERTSIKQNASFCIAGDGISVVFFYEPPPFMPNMKIKYPKNLINDEVNNQIKPKIVDKKPNKVKPQPKKAKQNSNENISKFMGEIKTEFQQLCDQITEQNEILNQLLNQNTSIIDLNNEIYKLLHIKNKNDNDD